MVEQLPIGALEGPVQPPALSVDDLRVVAGAVVEQGNQLLPPIGPALFAQVGQLTPVSREARLGAHNPLGPEQRDPDIVGHALPDGRQGLVAQDSRRNAEPHSTDCPAAVEVGANRIVLQQCLVEQVCRKLEVDWRDPELKHLRIDLPHQGAAPYLGCPRAGVLQELADVLAQLRAQFVGDGAQLSDVRGGLGAGEPPWCQRANLPH